MRRYPIVYTRRARYMGANKVVGMFLLALILCIAYVEATHYWYVTIPVAIVLGVFGIFGAVHSHKKAVKHG